MMKPKAHGLEREQDEIHVAQRAGELAEIIARQQRHVLHKRPQVAAHQRAEDQINRQRKNPTAMPTTRGTTK